MENNIEMVILYDIYGKLLTKKQQSIFEEYYLYNLSLREIAENKKISYQAVRDSIKSSEECLKKFDEIIGMKNNVEKIEKALRILENTDELNQEKQELIKILKE
jgi:hypothetical protein